jgi:hypothetical protein
MNFFKIFPLWLARPLETELIICPDQRCILLCDVAAAVDRQMRCPPIIKSGAPLFPGLTLNIAILPYLISLLYDLAHEHFLSKVINEEAAEHNEELLETADVTQKGQDVGYLP